MCRFLCHTDRMGSEILLRVHKLREERKQIIQEYGGAIWRNHKEETGVSVIDDNWTIQGNVKGTGSL